MSNALLEEPKGLVPEQIYVSGSACGVRCANCSETSTSGSWRRGWPLGPDVNANLCNKCGQRWVKLNKAIGRDVVGKESRPKQAVSRPQPAAATAHDASKRPRLAGDLTASQPTRTIASAVGSRIRSRLRSEEDSDEADAVDSPRAPLPSFMLQQNALPSSRFHSSAAGYAGYCFQKVACGRSTFALYWVIDPAGSCTLAVVGEDTRGSGHFTYRSSPYILGPSTAPLRCTNRTEVLAWLSTNIGVTRSFQESSLRLPLLTLENLQALMGFGVPKATHSNPMPHSLPAVATVPIQAASMYPMESLPDALEARRSSTTMSRPNRGAKIKPICTSNLPGNVPTSQASLRFGCSACGMHDHTIDDCPLACVSPPALIHDDALQPFFSDASLEVGHPNTAAMLLHEDDSPMQDTVFDEFLDVHCLGSPTDMAAASPGVVNQPAPNRRSMEASAAAAAAAANGHSSMAAAGIVHQTSSHHQQHQQEQQQQQQQHRQLNLQATQAFTPHPHLFNFVSELPSQGLEDTFRAWASVLSGHISDNPVSMAAAPSPSNPLGISRRWVPPAEALAVLHQLGSVQANLPLLERTQISLVVASLRTHPLKEIASAAESVVARWRCMAEAALQTATAAAGNNSR